METKVYAGFFVRLIAFAIDSLIAALAVSVVKSPLALAASSGANFLNANFLFHYSFLDVIDYVGIALYFVLLTYFTHTTPGKMLMRLEVVTADKDWTIWNIIYRETIGRFFSSIMCIGYFAVMVSPKKQGFHDMLCDTYVVYKGVMPKAEVAVATVIPAALEKESNIVPEEVSVVEPEETPKEESEQSTTIQEPPVVDEPKSMTVEAPVYYTKPVAYSHDEADSASSDLSE